MKKSLLIAVCVSVAFTACGPGGNKSKTEGAEDVVTSSLTPKVINYQLINVFPHDSTCFTEGLEYVNGQLYESAGQYGTSDIRKTDLQTGRVIKRTEMEHKYFGEGITVLNGKAYQLTYREQTGFIYDAATLKQLDKFSFTSEGWGMTNDGRNLIYSDGTNIIRYMDPSTMKQLKDLAVSDEHGPVNNINELEFIRGSIYANQWQTDRILKIDTGTGRVVARADLSSLRGTVGIPPISNSSPKGPEVLNGIAYDAAANRIFVTGKYWPKLLEIKLDN